MKCKHCHQEKQEFEFAYGYRNCIIDVDYKEPEIIDTCIECKKKYNWTICECCNNKYCYCYMSKHGIFICEHCNVKASFWIVNKRCDKYTFVLGGISDDNMIEIFDIKNSNQCKHCQYIKEIGYQPNRMFAAYQTLEILNLEEVNDYLRSNISNTTMQYGKLCGYQFKLHSQRYQLFMRDTQVCVCCGIKSSFWALQRTGEGFPHLNLWGINKDNKVVLFTKDHIMPKAKGGKDILENYQVMCATCNSAKGATITEEEICLKK